MPDVDRVLRLRFIAGRHVSVEIGSGPRIVLTTHAGPLVLTAAEWRELQALVLAARTFEEWTE